MSACDILVEILRVLAVAASIVAVSFVGSVLGERAALRERERSKP